MSITSTVFLERTKLPTAAAWAQAIRAQDFPFELSDFDPATHDGYLPGRYRDQPAGFELSLQPLADYFADQEVGPQDPRRKLAGPRDLAVSFITRSSEADCTAAAIAAAVLASTTGGLLWSDEAAEFTEQESLISEARSLTRASRPPPPPVSTAPIARPVELPGRIIFRGAALFVLETAESPSRRFTVKSGVPVEGDSATVVSIWEQPIGAPTAHVVRVGSRTFELDPHGAPIGGPPSIDRLVEQLGLLEYATQGLLAAGADAVPALLKVAERGRTEARPLAITLLGQIGATDAIPTLASLSEDPVLGGAARHALERMKARP